ncbi:MAG: hypothetical protein JSV84_14850 [Gemmatimonadota bacterium]|nr:MAG: hypothetical protein JSV84_14850 [Gemmatimonadota bacterium]
MFRRSSMSSQAFHGTVTEVVRIFAGVCSAFLLFTGVPSHAQHVRVDFVSQRAARVVDMDVGADGSVYLLNDDASIALLDSLAAKVIISLSQRESEYTLGKADCFATDARGNFFIGDGANGQILVFDEKGRFLRCFGPADDSETKLSEPTGIACDKFGRLFVADRKGYVFCYNNQGIYMGRLADLGKPVDIGVDRLGNLYVLDAEGAGIHVFDYNFRLLNTVMPGSEPRFTLSAPGRIFVEGDGTLYVTDIERCNVFIIGSAVTPGKPPSYYARLGVKGQGRGEFRSPNAVLVDGKGTLYVADNKNYNIQQFSLVGLDERKNRLVVPSEQMLPKGVVWIGDFEHSSAPNSRGLNSFTLDYEGNVYCADGEFNSIYVYTWAGSFLMNFGGEGADPGRLKKPMGIVWSQNKILHVADTGNNRLQQWSDSGVFQGQLGKKGGGSLEFNGPHAVALDDKGNFYVADKNNNRIQVLDAEGAFLRMIAGDTGAPLRKPVQGVVAVDGKVYVVEEGSRTVSILGPNGSRMSFIGDEERGPFQDPVSVDVDTSGNIYVLDTRTGIHVYDRERRPMVRFASSGNLIGQFRKPTHIELGPGGKIYVSDAEHNRISIFRLTHLKDGAVEGCVEPVPESGHVALYLHGQPVTIDSLFWDGSFFVSGIPPNEYTIQIKAPGYVQTNQVAVQIVPGRVVRTDMILLEENGSISGVVVPKVSEARVRLKKDLQYIAEATVNPDDGCFVFLDVRPGEYAIEVEAKGYVSPVIPHTMVVESGRVAYDTTYVKKPGSIVGFVSPPHVGALVTLFSQDKEITTVTARAENGMFQTPGLYAGLYRLAIRAQEYVEHVVENLNVSEGIQLDVGVIQLQRIKKTTPQARYLLEEGRRLHLSAEFERAQTAFLEAITTQEMNDEDLSEAYLWLAYSYFPFSEHSSKVEEALKKSIQLHPENALDESFSPEFRLKFESLKSEMQKAD